MTDNSMNDDPIDFTALDPTRNATRFNAVTGSIARDAMRARAVRAGAPLDVLSELSRWTTPALLAAALVIAVAISTLARVRLGSPRQTMAVSATDIMGIPPQLMDLVHSPRTPSLTQIDQALASVAPSPTRLP